MRQVTVVIDKRFPLPMTGTDSLMIENCKGLQLTVLTDTTFLDWLTPHRSPLVSTCNRSRAIGMQNLHANQLPEPL